MPHLRTLAFPDSDLLARVDAKIVDHQQSNIEFVVYSAEEKSPGVSRESIDGIILPYMDAGPTVELLGDLPNLSFVQTQTTGYDVLLGKVDTSKIQVATAAGVHASGTAELAVGLALASLRGIDDAVRSMAKREWDHTRRRSLADRKVLILGAGGIGAAIVERLEPFGVEITRVARTARDDEYGQIHSVDELP